LNARRKKIVVLRTFSAPVAVYDEATLRREYDVAAFSIVPFPIWRALLNQARLVLCLLWHIWGAEGVFWAFADWFAATPIFLCNLLRKRTWIVLAGYDAHHLPEYGYGAYIGRVRGWLTRYVVRNATNLLPVHESLMNGVNHYMQPSVCTGVCSLVDGILGRNRTINIGWDGDYWHKTGQGLSRVPTILCIANVTRQSRSNMWKLKGVPMLFETAKRMPDTIFMLVGIQRDGDAPKNVIMPGRVERDLLRSMLSWAWVYAHPSLTEGMSTSVGEAMLCECVPVVSGVNGDADLVGDTGVVVGVQDPDRWVECIGMGLDMARQGKGAVARERMLREFSLERRATALLEEMT